ncbi:MAG: hypothetical protein R2855_12315 [Thermomicrobiales bacterium]
MSRDPLKAAVAAVSVGVVRGTPLLDIDYAEDSAADVDFNVVMTDQQAFVEIQGTAEKSPFSHGTLTELLVLASTGLDQLFECQKERLPDSDQSIAPVRLISTRRHGALVAAGEIAEKRRVSRSRSSAGANTANLTFLQGSSDRVDRLV